MSLIKEFIEDVRSMSVRKGYCRTSGQKSEFALGYVEAFFEQYADEALRQRVRDRMDDLRETVL
jgi:hypothetical protein